MSTTSTQNLTEVVVAGGNLQGGEEAERYLKMDMELLDYYDKCVAEGTTSHRDSAYDLITHCILKNKYRPRPPAKHRGYELGAREFTLTYSPKWFDDETARSRMQMGITKLMKYYKDEIIDLRAVGEVGSNGLSHVHCFYKLKGGVKITDKNFKRAWPFWNPKKPMGRGFEGGHHQTVRSESDFLGYIEKDLDRGAWLDVNFSEKEHNPTCLVEPDSAERSVERIRSVEASHGVGQSPAV